MTNATLPLEGLDESIASLEEGESCEVCAMLKVVSKSGSEMEVELSDFEKTEDYESGGEDDGMGGESEDDYAGEQAPAARPKGKGMGILIMVKPSGKKY